LCRRSGTADTPSAENAAAETPVRAVRRGARKVARGHWLCGRMVGKFGAPNVAHRPGADSEDRVIPGHAAGS